MKKYIKPETLVVAVSCQQMIAASAPQFDTEPYDAETDELI